MSLLLEGCAQPSPSRTSPTSADFSPSIPSNPSTPRGHLGYLDGLRAMAALFVVLAHGWLEVWPFWRPFSPVWTHWLLQAHIAVDLFIVLSGFCLMLPVVRGDGTLRGGTATFFKRRARRILPPYYFAMALSLLLAVTLIGRPTDTVWDICLPVSARSIAVHLLLLQNFTPHYLYKINHAFWSISLEWWIYFLFPPLVWAWKKIGAILTAAASVVLSVLICAACDYHFHQSFTLQYIALFVFGMLGAEIVYGCQPFLVNLRSRLPWPAMAGGRQRSLCLLSTLQSRASTPRSVLITL